LQGRKDDTVDRLLRSLEKSMPQREEKAASKGKVIPRQKRKVPVAAEEPVLPDLGIEDLIARLPGGRIEGAFLPRKTFMHWIYGLLAGGSFLALGSFGFPGQAQALQLLLIAVFTATIGILLLLGTQLLADWTQGHILLSRNLFVLFVFWIAWAI